MNMKAKEFRSGNYIEVPFGEKWWAREIWDVLGSSGIIVTENGRYCFDGSNGTEEEFRPIQLTEEWLVKFGFMRIGSVWILFLQNNEATLQLWDGNKDISICKSGIGVYHSECKYVHQLQNLYFALTGEELTLIK